MVKGRPIARLTLSSMNGLRRFQSNSATTSTSAASSAASVPTIHAMTLPLRFMPMPPVAWMPRPASGGTTATG
jgi:hypothetical protein